jgi:hypothetical protein
MISRMTWLLGFVFLLLFGMMACAPDKVSIQREIDRAKYCEDAADCVDVGSKCPFGCSIVVNKVEAEFIRKLVQDYTTDCAYDCLALKEILCQEKKCKAVHE